MCTDRRRRDNRRKHTRAQTQTVWWYSWTTGSTSCSMQNYELTVGLLTARTEVSRRTSSLFHFLFTPPLGSQLVIQSTDNNLRYLWWNVERESIKNQHIFIFKASHCLLWVLILFLDDSFHLNNLPLVLLLEKCWSKYQHFIHARRSSSIQKCASSWSEGGSSGVQVYSI